MIFDLNKMNESLKYILTLTIICLITASLLTGVYLLTSPRILEQKAKSEQQALKEVLSPAGYFEPVVTDGKIVYFKAYLSADKNKIIGYAFRAKAKGYSSIIESVAGIDTQGRITGIKILAQNETPGLGGKICEILAKKTLWQAMKEFFTPRKKSQPIPDQPWFCAQFKDKKIVDLIVVKTPTEKNIQAITGATISSQALTDSVRKKAQEILNKVASRE